MESRLIMLPNPILVSDEEIEKGDWFYYYSHGKFNMYMCEGVVGKNLVVQNKEPSYWSDYSKKIIAGIEGLPKLDLSAIAEKIGWVDVENKVKELMGLPNYLRIESMSSSMKSSFEFGVECFKAAQSLNEKKYSEEDMIDFAVFAAKMDWDIISPIYNKTTEELFNLWLQQRKPKEYNVEVEMEEYDHKEEWSEIGGAFETFKTRIKVAKILR